MTYRGSCKTPIKRRSRLRPRWRTWSIARRARAHGVDGRCEGQIVMSSLLIRWLARTPVLTFVLCPMLVVAFGLVRRDKELAIVPAGVALLAWGYLQYLLVGRLRRRLGGGGPGLGVPPERIVATGPYRYVRN